MISSAIPVLSVVVMEIDGAAELVASVIVKVLG